MEIAKVLIQILFIMYWVVLGLLISLKVYMPPRSIVALSFFLTAIYTAILIFAAVLKARIYYW